MNQKIMNWATVRDVTRVVSGGYGTADKRQEIYNNVYEILNK